MATTVPSSAGSSRFAAPSWVMNLYSRFPLVTLEQEAEIPWKRELRNSDAECSLWVHPPASSSHPYHRAWASEDADSLRAQLLFLLRKVPVSFRHWSNELSAPGSKLPALQIVSDERLIPADQVRAWLDQTYPLKGKNKEIQNMRSQQAYDRGVALAQLVIGDLHTAYLSESSRSNVYKQIPYPPPLAAGLKTPLPAAFTGDSRTIDKQEIAEKGQDALEVIGAHIDGQWALGASQPTPLDALIGAHLYTILALKEDSALRRKAEELPQLGDYLDRILTTAGAGVKL